jgi:hypothetical protein
MKPRLSRLSSARAFVLLLASFSFSSLATAITYPEWRASGFSVSQVSNALVSGPTADPDGDEVKNLAEYVFAGRPLIADQNLSTSLQTVNGHLTLTYRERQGMSDVSIRLQGSDTLKNWITYNTVTEADREAFTGYDEVTLIDPMPFSQRRFLRVRLELLPVNEPLAPTQLALSVVSPTVFALTWTDPNKTETGYAVERLLPSSAWERLFVLGSDQGSWQHSSANYQISATYRTVALGSSGAESASAPATLTDTDNDGIPDALELKNSYAGVAGTYASDPNQFSSNGSGVSDGWQAANGFNPAAAFDGAADSDGDGLSDAQEAQRGTNPHLSDTDGDGVPDPRDGWPRTTWMMTGPLSEVSYTVVRLRALGWFADVNPVEFNDVGHILGHTSDSLYLARYDVRTGVTTRWDETGLYPDFFFSDWPSRRLSDDGSVMSQFASRDVYNDDEAARINPDGTYNILIKKQYQQTYPIGMSPSGTMAVFGWGDDDDPGYRIYLIDESNNSTLLSAYEYIGNSFSFTSSINGGHLYPRFINSGGVMAGMWTNRGTAYDLNTANPVIFHDGTMTSLSSGVIYDLTNGNSELNIPPIALSSQGISHPNGNHLWESEPLSGWDKAENSVRLITDGTNFKSNDNLEILYDSGKLIRNGSIHIIEDLIDTDWTIKYTNDINNYGVILAEATRTLDDQGLAIANPQSEPVLLIPYEVVTRDLGSSEVNGQHTEIVAASSPAPEVELTVVSATVTPSGSLSVVVSGTVADALSEVLTPSEPRVSQMRFKVDGQVIGQPVSLDYTAVSEPLRRTRSRTSFQQTLVIPNVKPRGYTIVAETDANAAGNIGWDKVAVGVNTELVPYTDEASKLSLVFTQAPTSSTPGIAKVYFGTRAPLPGDGTVTETAAGSRSYTGTLQVGAATATGSITLYEATVLTPGTADRLSATFTYQLPNQPAVRATGIWRETGPASQQFVPDGYSFSGERLVVNLTQDLPGSQPSSFEPMVLRLGVPAAWSQAGGFALTANGQNLTLKEFTYEGRTATYAVTSSSDTHPRIFVASSKELPASVAVANASNEGDTITWTLSLGGNQAFKVETQVVAGPEPFASELFAANLESLPRWASTNPGGGVGTTSNASVNGWRAPGDKVTITDLRNAYALLYPDGFSKLLLQVFDQQPGYSIELGDVLNDYDFEFINGNVTIQIEDDDDDINPVVAAQYLWQGLNKAHSTIFAFREAVANTAPTQALLEEAYMTWHANAGKAAAQAGVAVAEIYLSGIGIVNEGLDWVLVINDVTEGHYTSMAALLPFVPRAIVSNGGRYVIRNTSGVVRETISTISKFDAIPALYREKDLRVMGITMERENFGLFLRKALASAGGPIPLAKGRGELRRNMMRAGPVPTLYKVQAHHDFPYKFNEWFAEHGVNVNNPAFGRWVAESDHDLWHKRSMPKFNDFWETWIEAEKVQSVPYTYQQILDKLAQARATYPVVSGN